MGDIYNKCSNVTLAVKIKLYHIFFVSIEFYDVFRQKSLKYNSYIINYILK